MSDSIINSLIHKLIFNPYCILESNIGPSLPYSNYFTLPGNERYYKVSKEHLGTKVDFFILNITTTFNSEDAHEPDGVEVGSIQHNWFVNAVTNSDADFKIVLVHDEPHGSFESSPIVQSWNLEQYADVVLSGDIQAYERSLIRTSLGAALFLSVGVGGLRLEDDDPEPSSSSVTLVKEHGALFMQINSEGLNFEFKNKNGKVRDSFTLRKNPVDNADYRKAYRWGHNQKRGTIGNLYYYNNRHTEDREYFKLLRLKSNGLVQHFPINKSSNKFWQYIGVKKPKFITTKNSGLIQVLSPEGARNKAICLTNSGNLLARCNKSDDKQRWIRTANNQLINTKRNTCLTIDLSQQVDLQKCSNRENQIFHFSGGNIITNSSPRSCLSIESNSLIGGRPCDLSPLFSLERLSRSSYIAFQDPDSPKELKYSSVSYYSQTQEKFTLQPLLSSLDQVSLTLSNGNISASMKYSLLNCQSANTISTTHQSLKVFSYNHLRFQMICSNRKRIELTLHLFLSSSGELDYFQ